MAVSGQRGEVSLSHACLVGEKPDVLRAGIVRVRGSMVIRLRPFTR